MNKTKGNVANKKKKIMKNTKKSNNNWVHKICFILSYRGERYAFVRRTSDDD